MNLTTHYMIIICEEIRLMVDKIDDTYIVILIYITPQKPHSTVINNSTIDGTRDTVCVW